MYVKDKHEPKTINFSPRLVGKQLYNLLSDASLCKCDVISGQNKKFKLKYLVNKTLEGKSTEELVLQFQKFFHMK